MKVKSISEIPKRATIRSEYTKCSNQRCLKLHGPYLYAYWKENGKLNKVYIGRSEKDFQLRMRIEEMAAEYHVSKANARKLALIEACSESGDAIARKYRAMILDGKCSIAWAYRKVYSRNKELKMATN